MRRSGTAAHPRAPRVERPSSAVAGDVDLRRCRIEPDDLDTGARDVPSDLSLAASDVEDPLRAPEVGRDQWEDLLFVFGVGAGGELALPPSGVTLPQSLVLHDHSISARDPRLWHGLGPPVITSRG